MESYEIIDKFYDKNILKSIKELKNFAKTIQNLENYNYIYDIDKDNNYKLLKEIFTFNISNNEKAKVFF